MFQVEAAVSNSQSSVVEASKARVPVSIWSVLRHMPVEIRRAVVPPSRTAFAERALDFVDGPMRGRFRLAVRPLLGVAYRSPGGHQPANERDRGLPCAKACRGRRSRDELASPDASRYAK